MKFAKLAYYSGKIETKSGDCYVGGQKVDCPKQGQTLFERPFMESAADENWSPDILSRNFMPDARNDLVFVSIFATVLIFFAGLAITKVKIIDKPLAEYITPIWYFVLGSLLAVLSQYTIVQTYSDQFPFLLRGSQLFWEVMVGLSTYLLVKKHNFSFGNVFFLGILYSFIVHGTKVSIRYFFYGKTLFYVLDRFIYGSLLVMLLTFVLGSILILFRRRGVFKF